jgi:hypothetical protein
VIKPRDGAGSEKIALVRSRREWEAAAQQFAGSLPRSGPILQPYIPGKALSVGAIVMAGNQIEIFPVGEQRLSDDGCFGYEGGQIPAGCPVECDVTNEVRRIVMQACPAVPGLLGYVGLDFVAPTDRARGPLVVEINPRLTTAYLGYRALTHENLAERLIFPDREWPPIVWNNGPVSFRANGQLIESRPACSGSDASIS